jgi:beta-lactamase class A
MLRLLVQLAEGRVHGRTVSNQVLRLMGETQGSDMLPRYLEVNPYAAERGVARPPFTVRHKTGSVTGTRNDAGLITRTREEGRPETLAICVYTKDLRDERWTAANAGAKAVARVSKLACDHFFKAE